MSNEEKLEIVNSIQIEDYDTDGENLFYAYASDNPDTRKRLSLIVDSVYQYIADQDFDTPDDMLDIAPAAFGFCGATWFDGERFLDVELGDDGRPVNDDLR